MAEYIDRDVAKDELLSWAVCIKHPEHLMKEDAMHILDSIPAADVVEVAHGRWVSDEGDVLFHCSVCETQISTSWDYDCDEMWNFCPHCGARMDGER